MPKVPEANVPRDVYVESKHRGPQRISELHPLYMALQYHYPPTARMASMRKYHMSRILQRKQPKRLHQRPLEGWKLIQSANPKWPEMGEMLCHCIRATMNDRPDLITRLFKLKLGQLMHDIKTKQIFGPIKAESNKVKTGKDIDVFISVEIPCQETDLDAYRSVTEHMLHGPCGNANKSSPCMHNGQCTKHFPKPFSVYRRRDNGVHVKKGTSKLDNIPYNRYLLLKYNAHINVEWFNRTRAIKYLFKYINKGPDRATVMVVESTEENGSIGSRIRRVIDEIKQYLECRYLSTYEAKLWTIRKSQEPIGRIVYYHPSGGEKYYLRMMLNVVKGPTSFEEIRTVDGKLYGTYREACYARGMLNDDNEWTDAIQEE
ncbi:LOW QUALITY PROTEIN: hypothetical protein V2J09_006226 [Rumex salicifolius]